MVKRSSKFVAILTAAFMGGLPAVVLAEENKSAPKTLESFDYASHRNVPAIDGKCYEGKIFNYNLLSDDTIAQADKKGVKIDPVWFYDIDNDGKFGKAEMDAIKAGIPIFMHQAFNDIANAKVRKFLEEATEYSSLREKLEQTEKNSEAKDSQHQIIEKMYHTLVDSLIDDLAKAKVQIAAENSRSDAIATSSYQQEYERRMANAEKQEALAVPDSSLYMREYQKRMAFEEPAGTPIPSAPNDTAASREAQKEKDYRSVWLQAQETANADLNSYITSIGARWNPFKNLDLGFGANLDIGFGLDKQTDSYSHTFTNGKTFSGTSTDIGKFSIGGSLEAQLGPFFLGGGIDYKLWTENVIEQILSQSGDVLKSNINAVPNRQIFGKVYGGLEVPLGDNIKVGVLVGYNGRDGIDFGIRGGLKIK